MKNYSDYTYIKKIIDENNYLKVCLYIAGGITCIWIFGKGAILLANATNNFKRLISELKS